MKKLVLLLMMLLSLTLVASAQEANVADNGELNDPTTNDRANACFGEGVMAGICEEEQDWECGWYVIRFEYGVWEAENVPEYCKPYLVYTAPPQVETASIPGGMSAAPSDMRRDPLINRCADIGERGYAKIPNGTVNAPFSFGSSFQPYSDQNCRFVNNAVPPVTLWGTYVVSPSWQEAARVCGVQYLQDMRQFGGVMGSTEFRLYQC